MRAEERSVAAKQAIAKCIGGGGNVNLVSGVLHPAQRVQQGCEHRQIRGRSDGAGVWGEVEQHNSDFPVRTLLAPQCNDPCHPGGQHRRPFRMRHHVAPVTVAGLTRSATERHRPDPAVQFRYSHHHRGLDRQQAPRIIAPLFQCLELNRMRGDIRHVQLGQQLLGCPRIVVGRPANQAEAGQRHNRIDRCLAVMGEVGPYRLALIQAAGKGGNDLQASCFERRDDAVIMRGVAG